MDYKFVRIYGIVMAIVGFLLGYTVKGLQVAMELK